MKYKLLLCLLMIMLVATLAVSCSSEVTETTDTVAQTELPQTTPIVSDETSEVPFTTTPITTNTPISTTVPAVHKITPEEAKTMIDQGGVTVVDVRRIDEYEQSHIPGAILVSNETILEEAAFKLSDLSAVILIYCRSGRRSAEAAEKLISLGYTNVYDFGGILDWPYETTQ